MANKIIQITESKTISLVRLVSVIDKTLSYITEDIWGTRKEMFNFVTYSKYKYDGWCDCLLISDLITHTEYSQAKKYIDEKLDVLKFSHIKIKTKK